MSNIPQTAINNLDESCYNLIKAICIDLIRSNLPIIHSWHISDAKKFLFTPIITQYLIEWDIVHQSILSDCKNSRLEHRYEMLRNVENVSIMLDEILAEIYQEYNA